MVGSNDKVADEGLEEHVAYLGKVEDKARISS